MVRIPFVFFLYFTGAGANPHSETCTNGECMLDDFSTIQRKAEEHQQKTKCGETPCPPPPPPCTTPQTKIDCKKASQAAGFKWDGTRSWSDRLPGCLVTKADNHVNWNKDTAGQDQNDEQIPFCEEAAEGQSSSGVNTNAFQFEPETIKGFQWNPHYQCFNTEADTCQGDAVSNLNDKLATGIDFANIVELEDDGYAPPNMWQNRTQKCGVDQTTLLWDSSKWTAEGSGSDGCTTGSGQYVVQAFDQQGFKVVVVGAHFPHPDGSPLGTQLQAMATSIAQVKQSSGSDYVLLMADTNQEDSVSSADIFTALGLVSGPDQSTELFPSCCAKTPDGFIHTYDRVISNFGEKMSTEKVFDDVPSWAGDEMHIGVIGDLLI